MKIVNSCMCLMDLSFEHIVVIVVIHEFNTRAMHVEGRKKNKKLSII